MIYLRKSTISQNVLIGPFIDDTDGKTAETALTIANTDIRISKNGANIIAKNSGGATHDENGFYQITLDDTDTDTVGRLQLHCLIAGALAVFHDYIVLEQAIYDAIYASGAIAPSTANALATVDTVVDAIKAKTDNLPASPAAVSDIATALNNYDGPTNAEMIARTLPSAEYATAANLATVDTVVDAIKIVTDAIPDGGALTALLADITAILQDTGTDIPATLATLSTAASLASVAADITAILQDTGTDIPATLAAIAGYIDTEIAAIKTVTDSLPNGGALTDLATAASLATVDTVVDAIKAKTDNLPASPAAVSDIPTAAANAAGLLDLTDGIETGLTLREATRLFVSALVGKASGLETTTARYRDYGDTKDRIVATVDANGNRTAVTRNVL